MRSRAVVLWTVAAVLLIQHSLLAHHSSALFASGKKVILKGTVQEWVYSNPHCMLILEVKREDGQMVQWTAETQAPASIFPVGYRRDSFKAGDQVTITVEPFKDGRPYGRIIGAVLADGKILGPATAPPSTAGAAATAIVTPPSDHGARKTVRENTVRKWTLNAVFGVPLPR